MLYLGQRIQKLRLSRGLSQEAFGAQLGTTRQTVSKWELGQSVPEVGKIILMCRLFSVSADAILLEDTATPPQIEVPYACGIYRGDRCELCETEKYALYLYERENFIGMQLFSGNAAAKSMLAVCEHELGSGITRYAYRTNTGTITNDNEILVPLLGETYTANMKCTMRQTDTFFSSHSPVVLPTVSEAGIERCLLLWRMADSCTVSPQQLHFFLCTGTREYIFSIRPQNTNIYCGASCNYPFALGMMAGGQYFRIRNFGDNTAPFCRFHADFSYVPYKPQIPFDEVALGQCIMARTGMLWCLKRYDEDIIVLQGCGSDEYIYRRHDRRDESFVLL